MGAVWATDSRLRSRVCAVEVLPDLVSASGMEDQAQEQFSTEAACWPASTIPICPRSPITSIRTAGSTSSWTSCRATICDRSSTMPGAARPSFGGESSCPGQRSFLRALSYLHARSPVLHRDIKPSNIKLTRRWSNWSTSAWSSSTATPDESRTVTVVQGRGTVAYTPPNGMAGDSAGHTDVRSDVYSLGATLYTC